MSTLATPSTSARPALRPMARSPSQAQPPSEGGEETGRHRRLDIQGLRALAVVMVVAFHAGLPVPGGFVGVDVFFVISGFVITGLLRREWEATGRIRFGAFYIRRFKRLTPALALMVAITAIASSLVLSPLGPQQNVAETGIGAMLLVANWVIASATGGYFDAAAETNPLLHTWTLSVEEQFYLVFPAILALGWVLARRIRRLEHAAVAVVGLVAAASFVLADISATGYSPSWLLGFFSPVTRAWEFALGALLALAGARLAIRSRAVTFGLGLLGAGMLVTSLWVITANTPFPGSWTLLPVVGTLLLLLVGTHRPSLVTGALATKPMATIGDWSYSIYLWHWPFIAVAALLWPETPYAPLTAAALSLAPAIASYRWVEQPIRSRGAFGKPRIAALIAIVVLSPVLVAGAVGLVATHFWTPRYETGGIAVAHDGDIGQLEWHGYLRDTFYPCTPKEIRARALIWEGIVRCHQSAPGSDVSVALIGDSHAEHLFVGLAESLPRENVAYYIRDDALSTANPEFARIVNHVAASSSIETVVVSSLWSFRGVGDPGLLSALRALSSAGKNVFVTDDVPYFPFDPFVCKYRKALFLPSECSMDAGTFRRGYSRYYPRLVATVERVPGAKLVRTARYFCGESDCDMTRAGHLLYRDRNHLNLLGSRFVAERLLEDNPAFAASVAHHR
jgi:peptidoglycan/LPS O-acetylase OafA/YrhL